MRMSWSVNLAWLPGNSTLGMWQLTQLPFDTGQTFAAVAAEGGAGA
jgi:hypothetical protein